MAERGSAGAFLWLLFVASLALTFAGDAPWRLRAPFTDPGSAPSAGDLWGEVVDVSGAPIPSASVSLSLLLGEGARRAALPVSSDGRFSAHGLPLGRYRVEARAPGFLSAESEILLSLKQASARVRLTLDPAAEVAGKVVDSRGDPVIGAIIVAAPPAGLSPEEEPPSVTSGARGEFAFVSLTPGAWVLSARTEGGLVSEPVSVKAPARGVLLKIPDGAALSGTVVDNETGAPLGFARVRLGGSGIWPPRAVSADIAGRFSLSGVPRGVYTLLATGLRTDGSPLFAMLDGLKVEGSEGRAGIVLALKPAWTLRGVVRDEAGTSLAGAEILLSEDPFFVVARRVFADGEGRFSFESVPPGEVFVRVLSEDLPPSDPLRVVLAPGLSESEIPPPDDAEALDVSMFVPEPSLAPPPAPSERVFSVDLVVPAGQVVSGQVVDEQGYPFAGALVLVRSAHGGEIIGDPSARRARTRWEAEHFGFASLGGDPSSFFTGPDGRFSIVGVRDGEVVAVASAPGYAPASAACGEGVPCKIELVEAGDIRGRVVDSRGYPVEGVSVRAAPPGGSTFEVVFAISDARGFFLLEPVGAPVDIKARAQGYAPRSVQGIEAGERDLEIVLDGLEHSLGGRVVDSRGFPIEGARLEVSVGEVHERAATAEDGTFTVANLPPGEAEIRVACPGYAPLSLRGSGDELEITLLPGAILSGQILNEDGDPLYFVQVEVVLSGTSIGVFSADGNFHFGELPPGDGFVRVTASGYATTQRLISLQQGDEQRIEIRLSQAGALRGVASFDGGVPAPSAAVVLAGPGGERITLTTNKDGSFSAANLAPGSWIVTATARGLTGRAETTVEAEETSRVSLLVGEEAPPVEEVVEARGARWVRQKGAWTVASVEAGSAAQEADLFPGDVLRNINGAPPGDAASLQAKLAASGPLELIVFGEDGEVKVTIE